MSDEQTCPFCKAIHKNNEFLAGDIGKWYLGVVQIFCLSCGMPFEVSQKDFILANGCE